MKLVKETKKMAYVICQRGNSGSKFIDSSGNAQNECMASCFIYDRNEAMTRLDEMNKTNQYTGQLVLEQYEVV
jgi:hypothetical protein